MLIRVRICIHTRNPNVIRIRIKTEMSFVNVVITYTPFVCVCSYLTLVKEDLPPAQEEDLLLGQEEDLLLLQAEDPPLAQQQILCLYNKKIFFSYNRKIFLLYWKEICFL